MRVLFPLGYWKNILNIYFIFTLTTVKQEPVEPGDATRRGIGHREVVCQK